MFALTPANCPNSARVSLRRYPWDTRVAAPKEFTATTDDEGRFALTGTSALFRLPRDVIRARFGADSAKRHREAAERAAGVSYRELSLPSLAIDVDVEKDAREILACPTLGRRTREALQRLEVTSR